MSFYQTVALPALLVFAIAQLALLILLGLAVLARRRAEDPAPDAMAALVAQLEPPLQRLVDELHAEHERLRALADQLARLSANLASRSVTSPEPTLTGSARYEARRLLAEGRPVDEVVAATGLPRGEVKVLANLVARQPEAAATP